MPPRPVISPAEAAQMFGVDTKTVTRWADEGIIRSFRTPGGHRRFYRADVERVIAERTTEATHAPDA